MINKITESMIKYNGKDVRRINHAIKVFCFAQYIALKENCSKKLYDTICISSILHDIGIHNAEKNYNSTAGNYQEIEGPIVAKQLLADIDLAESIKERVLYLIGNHHSYNKIDDIDFQILVEADFIVNIDEDKLPKDSVESVKKKIFKTKSGLELLEMMYL